MNPSKKLESLHSWFTEFLDKPRSSARSTNRPARRWRINRGDERNFPMTDAQDTALCAIFDYGVYTEIPIEWRRDLTIETLIKLAQGTEKPPGTDEELHVLQVDMRQLCQSDRLDDRPTSRKSCYEIECWVAELRGQPKPTWNVYGTAGSGGKVQEMVEGGSSARGGQGPERKTEEEGEGEDGEGEGEGEDEGEDEGEKEEEDEHEESEEGEEEKEEEEEEEARSPVASLGDRLQDELQISSHGRSESAELHQPGGHDG